MLEHFHSDWNGTVRNTPFHDRPSQEVIRDAMASGRVQVGNTAVIYRDNCIVVAVKISNGFGGNLYRDMYRIVS